MERKQNGGSFWRGAWTRMLSLILAFVMLLSLLPATDLLTQVRAAATQTVCFRDSNNWGTVYGYAWDSTGNKLLGEWPGTKLSEDSSGLYKMTVSVTGSLNFIFNNGVGGTGNQTSDLSLSATQIAAGKTYTVDGTNGFPATAGGPVIVGNTVTFTYVGGASTVLLTGTMNDWAGVAMYKTGSSFTYTCRLEAGTYEYKFVVDGNWVSDPTNPNVIGPDNNSYIVVTADSAKMDYEANLLRLKVTAPVDASEVFLIRADGSAADVHITGFSYDDTDSTCTLNLSRLVMLEELPGLRVRVNASEYMIEPDGYIFYSDRFHRDYTYTGDDLGATWSKNGTTFKAWAPTAWDVKLIRYSAGNGNFDSQGYDKTWIEEIDMVRGDKGVWTVTVPGDLHGTYYNYKVTFPHKTHEAVDPYAKSTGIDGYRSMVLNMASTNPVGWDSDVSPNQGMSYTDAIIYEMHIREYTVHSTSGVKEAWRGKYLGMTQQGTSYQGHSTGLDHLKELGVTHVQIMPFNDFEAGISETDAVNRGEDLYGWGYNPKNFNTPEGSYSTDPFHGEVRVNELKQMIQALHSNGINVIMDSVYNHVVDGGGFSYNRLVPSYFSRFHGPNDDWSRENHCNSSGCGNDFATQRAMARKYIVDSILYWVEEYHVDGFRFDLAGLIDAETMNEAINTVHAKYPHVIFYGEGWEKTDSNMEGAIPCSQYYAPQVPGFAFFNHVMRDSAVGGEHEASDEWGFGMGNSSRAETVMNSMRAINWGWANGWYGPMENPSQVINYVACHDKYTLTDKVWYKTHDEMGDRTDISFDWYKAAANRLTNTVILLSQGIPLMYSGDEILRQKTKEDGWPAHNSGHEKHDDGSDFTNAELDKLNAFDWSNPASVPYADVTKEYYKGLIEFRKNHAALRCNYIDSNGTPDSKKYTSSYRISDQCIMIYVDGFPNNECSDGIVIILNSGTNSQWVNFYDYGIPQGNWQACIHGDKAGVEALWSTTSGEVGVEACSATVLVKGDLVDENSVYNRQGVSVSCRHTYHDQNGICTGCGITVEHSYVSGTCTVCGKVLPGSDTTKTVYVDVTGFSWNSVNVYSWVGDTACTGQWPGAAMTKVEGNIYSYEVPSSATYIIFNDGTNQTNDLIIPTDGRNLYNYKQNSWSTYETECSHSYTSKVTMAASCTQNGLRTYTCSFCSLSYTELIPATGHSYTAEVCPPNCTSIGYTVYTCGNCFYRYQNDYLDATPHTYANGSCTACGAVDPNYVVPGSTTYYLIGWINGADYGCESDYQNMGIYKFVDGKLTAKFDQDSYIFVKTEGNGKWLLADAYCELSTCTFKVGGADKMFIPGGVELTFTLVENADGSVTVSYTQGGATACTHSYTSKVTTAATCNSNGVMTYTCAKCGSSYTESIPAISHNFVSGHCTYCGAFDSSTALSDTYYLVGWINGADYGCESDYENNGIYKFVNGQLTAKFDEDSYVFVKTENNGKWLLADAYTESNTCTLKVGGSEKMFVPGGVQLIFSIVVNADGSVTVSYTEGTTSECNHSYTAEVTTAATCTATGIRTYTCSKCGDRYTQSIPATGHNFFDGKCNVCGAAEPNAGGTTYYLVGWINGADYGCEGDYKNMGDYKFVDGKLTATFTSDSYVFVKTEGNGQWLLANSYCEASTCAFVDGGTEKMFVPGGVELNFTLTENANGGVTVTYTNGSTPASVVPTLTLKSPTLEFKDMITVNAFYTAENTQDIVEMGMITYSSQPTFWSVRTADHIIPGATYVESTGRYYSASQGIYAKYLADTVYLAIYAKLADGSYAYSKLAPYSPLTYANSQLKNATDIKLKQLVVAMLNYGAEAQLYFGHNTGNLANAALTAAQLALPSAYNESMVHSVAAASAAKQGSLTNNQGFASRKPAISFEGAFCINYFFTPNYAPDHGITLYYWNATDYNANSVLTTANASGSIKLSGSGTGEYRGDITGIAAKNIDQAVYVAAVYTNGGTTWTSGVLGYSIGAYCSGQISKGSDIASLAKATAVYGYHAKQYFG